VTAVTAAPGSLTLAPFGSQRSATFSARGREATASGLVLFGEPNHTCVITCEAPDRFAMQCTNVTTGGACSETFRK
jgi:hypothetical protein